jgi:hypothetical protein
VEPKPLVVPHLLLTRLISQPVVLVLVDIKAAQACVAHTVRPVVVVVDTTVVVQESSAPLVDHRGISRLVQHLHM